MLGLYARTDGIGNTLHGYAYGSGYAGYFEGGQGVEIDGNLKVTDSLMLLFGASDGYVMTSDVSGNASWQAAGSGSVWESDGSGVYLGDTTTFVGIGTTSPAVKLDVSGVVHVSDRFDVDGYYSSIDIGDPTESATLRVFRSGVADEVGYFGSNSRGGSLVLYDEAGNALPASTAIFIMLAVHQTTRSRTGTSPGPTGTA